MGDLQLVDVGVELLADFACQAAQQAVGHAIAEVAAHDGLQRALHAGAAGVFHQPLRGGADQAVQVRAYAGQVGYACGGTG